MERVSGLEIIDNIIIDSQFAALCLALTNTIDKEEILKIICIKKV